MNIVLQTNNESQRLELRNIRKMGQSYQCFLVVDSRGFNATRGFYFDEHHLKMFLANLNEMDAKLEGEAILGHLFEDDQISLKGFKNGHVVVSGSLAEHSEYSQKLEFCFQTDQTVLKPLIKDFSKLQSDSRGEAK
jgi:hypothetical protein